MVSNVTTARPYARALFALACDAKQQQEWLSILHVLAMAVTELNAIHAINNPAVSAEQLSSWTIELLEHLLPSEAEKTKSALSHLLHLLIAEKRLLLAPEIADTYQQLLREFEAVKEVAVISAYPLNDAQSAAIKKALQKRFDQAVTVEYRVDDSLIGGAMIKAGNWVMDGSVRGSLDRLSDRLERIL